MKYFRLYRKFIIQYVKSLMQNKLDFFLGLFGFFMMQASGIAFLFLVFEKIPNLNGWSFDEIVFIYGFAQLPRGIDHLFTDNIWLLSSPMIVRGNFDRYLIRPINPLFHLIADRFQPDALGELIVGCSLITISLSRLHLSLGLIDIMLMLFAVLCGSVIYTSIKLFFASLAFWIKDSFSIMHLTYMTSEFAKYPLSIYSKPIQIAISFIIPFAFAAFFPASYFVNKANFIESIGTGLIVAIVSFCIAYFTWLQGIKVYESAGN